MGNQKTFLIVPILSFQFILSKIRLGRRTRFAASRFPC